MKQNRNMHNERDQAPVADVPTPSADQPGHGEVARSSTTPPSLARNAVVNLGSRLLLIALALLSTPIVVHALGTTQYGVYVLALSLGGLLNILDLGLTPAVIMLLSRSWHERSISDMQRIVSTGFSLFLSIGLIGGVALALLVPWMTNSLLHVPVPTRSATRVTLWLSTGAFTLNMWLAVFNAVPMALERYDLVAVRIVGVSLAGTVAIIVISLAGGGLLALMLINLLMSIAGLVVFYIMSRRLLPVIRLRPGFDAATFRQLARFSGFKFAGTLGVILTFRFDQFAIGALMNVRAVGYYAVPANGALRVFSALSELIQPLFPRVSKLGADGAARRTLFLQSARIMTMVSFGTLTILFVFADLILRYWIHGDQGRIVAAQATPAFRWLLLAFLIESLATVPSIFSEALNRPEINNGFAVAGALIHIPLVLLLVPHFGITGAAIALFIHSVTQTSVFVIYASKNMAGVGVWELLTATLARPVAAALATAVGAYLLRIVVHGLLELAMALIGALFLYVLACFGFAAVRREDLITVAHTAERLPMNFPGRGKLVRLAND
jgi:O-antigen/teichoic acid export membrane protein